MDEFTLEEVEKLYNQNILNRNQFSINIRPYNDEINTNDILSMMILSVLCKSQSEKLSQDINNHTDIDL